MTALVERLGGWIGDVILALGYPGIVAAMALENVFPPIPSEAVLPFAGALAAQGELSYWGVVASGTVGSLLGAVILYGVGYAAREAGVRRLVAAYGKFALVSERDLDRAAAWFARYGEAVVLFGRLVPIMRSIVSVPAGYARMPLGRFLAYTAVGTALWSAGLTTAGYALGENWEDIRRYTAPYEQAALWALLIAVAAFVAWRALPGVRSRAGQRVRRAVDGLRRRR